MIKYVWILFSIPLFSYELSIAAIFRNEANRLKEWIEYHRMVGVEHFWLYNNASEDHWKEILRPYIEQEIVEVVDWCTDGNISYIQTEAYRDALEKAKGKSEWLAFIDLDEYFLPTQEATMTECLFKHFSHAAAVYVNWRHFGTGGIWLEPGEPILNRLLTASDDNHPRNACGKSIVRPNCTTDIWNPHHAVIDMNAIYCYGDATSFSHDRDLRIDGRRHPGFLVLNHYTMGDENYFKEVRLPRAKKWGIEPWLTYQLYDDYNEKYDFSMIDFLKEKHPRRYVEFWNMKRPGIELNLDAPTLGDRLFQAAAGCAIAWEKGTELFFSNLDFLSEDFQHFFFRAPPLPEEKGELTPLTIHNPNRASFEKHRHRLLEFLAPHPKDKLQIRKQFYWIDDNQDTVGVYITPQEDPTYVQEYVKRAVSFFGDNAIYLVCCKDSFFAKSCFPDGLDNVYFVENKTESIHLRILSLCANNIIDSSSLAWWGAWLNQNPDKVVICPNPGDYPSDWIQMHLPEYTGST